MPTAAEKPEAAERPQVIWRLLDGKPGHENQTLGLLRALERLAAERGQAAPQCIELPVADQHFSLWGFILAKTCRRQILLSVLAIARIGPCSAPVALSAAKPLR